MNGAGPNALFLRLEGPLQAWGDNSKFVIRRTHEAPTKSGVLGMICCARGKSRPEARKYLKRLNQLRMGVRIDRAGILWSDYHTVGAGIGLLTAEGKLKTDAQGTLPTRRYYLCDASFVVALHGDTELIQEVYEALKTPRWPIYLGRKSCPPSRPVVGQDEPENLGTFDDLRTALASCPWRPRYQKDKTASTLDLPCLIEWRAASQADVAPSEAEVWHDVAVSFDPPVHQPRLVVRETVTVTVGAPLQTATHAPPRPRADYQNEEYREARRKRLEMDHHLCVFCKSPVEGRGATVQHVTYRRAGGAEELDDLRTLCRLCHDAVTMIEYGLGMGLDRINPEEPPWRDRIIAKRDEIVRFRSLETRRRRLEPEEVE